MRNGAKALTFSALTLAGLVIGAGVAQAQHSRRDPLTEAVAKSRDGVVAIKYKGGKNEAVGSGVILDDRGFIVTNRHVIGSGKTLLVRLSNGTELPAKILVSDADTDLAVLRITTKLKLKALPLAPASDLILAEQVFAIGHPFNYSFTVTRGIISALDREIELPDGRSLSGIIQTDASINPGNSGGPLLNINGEMIGINVALRSGAQGIAFAINTDTVKSVLNRFLSAEKVAGVSHGLDVQERVTGEVGERQKVVVAGLRQELPGAKAGLKSGDELVAIGRLPVRNCFDVERALWHTHPGEKIDVQVAREGKQITLTMTLSGGREQAAQLASAKRSGSGDRGGKTTVAQTAAPRR
jgi:serine protease Do